MGNGTPGSLQEISKDIATDIARAHPEVEFALVLARTIESVKNDPEQLRSAIYELARQKLHEQVAPEDEQESRRLLGALEVAIRGVEAHSRKVEQQQFFPLTGASEAPPSRQIFGALDDRQRSLASPAGALRQEAVSTSQSSSPSATFASTQPRPASAGRRTRRFGAPLRYLAVVVLIGVVVIAFQRRIEIVTSGRKIVALLALAKTVTPAPSVQPAAVAEQIPAPPPAPPAPTPGLPTAYGVYAVNSAGKLYELEPLIGRVPDVRVAISAAITKPSETTVPDGHLKFIVYRHDSGTTAPDQAEVRLIAKVVQATTFDAAGKPVVAPSDDIWVIRNVSFPYRTAPIKDNPEMYEVQPRNADAELSPGRYGVVLRGQAYDFTVDGPVTDKRHCLERLAASNGVFYSECQKP